MSLCPGDIATLSRADYLERELGCDGIFPEGAGPWARFRKLVRRGLLRYVDVGRDIDADRDVHIFAITDAGRAALATADPRCDTCFDSRSVGGEMYKPGGDPGEPPEPCPDCHDATGAAFLPEANAPPEGDGYQLWETVSEGSPVSKVYPTEETFTQYLVGEGYSEKAARAFCKTGWAPSMIMVDGRAYMDVEAAALSDRGEP